MNSRGGLGTRLGRTLPFSSDSTVSSVAIFRFVSDVKMGDLPMFYHRDTRVVQKYKELSIKEFPLA